VNKFFEGVDGALVLVVVIGGVLVRMGSSREDMAELRVLYDGGSACGTSLWNSSDLNRCVKVLFACSSGGYVSATVQIAIPGRGLAHSSENVALPEAYASV
jgi:hypothetical protein